MTRWKLAALIPVMAVVAAACSTSPQTLSVEAVAPSSSARPASPPRTNGSVIDSTPDLSRPRTVLYSTARSIGDIKVTVDVETDSPMLRIVHEGYQNAQRPIDTPIVSWPIPSGCYPDQSYTLTIDAPSAPSPFVARNYDYRYKGPFSVRIATNYGFPPSYASGV